MERSGTRPLIVYFSRTGHCEKIARELQALTGADIDRLLEVRDYSGKASLSILALRSVFRHTVDLKATRYEPAYYDDLILVTPVYAGNICPAVRTYVDLHAEQLHRIRLVMCTGFSEKRGIADRFRADYGLNIWKTLTLNIDEVDNGIYREFLEKFVSATTSSPTSALSTLLFNKENTMKNSDRPSKTPMPGIGHSNPVRAASAGTRAVKSCSASVTGCGAVKDCGTSVKSCGSTRSCSSSVKDCGTTAPRMSKSAAAPIATKTVVKKDACTCGCTPRATKSVKAASIGTVKKTVAPKKPAVRAKTTTTKKK